MPDISIIDAHAHLWDPNVLNYPWLKNVPLLNKPYLIDDYNEHTKNHSIAEIVFVQCECEPFQYIKEVEWVCSIAEQDKRITGIVAWAPVEFGRTAIPILSQLAAKPLVKGIRRIIQFESDADFCLRRSFIEGVQLLADYNFSFDICISHNQLPKVIQLVEKCPGVKFMLDHFGKPDIANHVFDSWESGIKTLAQFENVECKLSGLVTEADHNNWHTDDLEPYLKTVMNEFGENRLVFGGDWPVVLQASSYSKWINTTDTLLSSLNDTQLKKIYYQNAQRFYKLK